MHSGVPEASFLAITLVTLSRTFFLVTQSKRVRCLFMLALFFCHVLVSTLTPFSNNLLYFKLCKVTHQAVMLLPMGPRCFTWHLSVLPCAAAVLAGLLSSYSACLSELQKLPGHSESYQGL